MFQPISRIWVVNVTGGTHPEDRRTREKEKHPLAPLLAYPIPVFLGNAAWITRTVTVVLCSDRGTFIKMFHGLERSTRPSFNLSLSPQHLVAPTITKVLIGCPSEVW